MSGAAGRAVLLTRPLEASRALAADLSELGVETEIWPLTRIVPTATGLRLPADTQAVLATSAHGLRAMAALTGRRDLPVLAVGDATAAVARRLGFAMVFSASGRADDLAALATASGLRRFLHPRGRDATGDLAERLGEKGCRVHEAVVYAAEETGPPPAPVAHALDSGRIGLITVWSPRNAAILVRRLADRPQPPEPFAFLAISGAAAAPVEAAYPGAVAVAERPDRAAMLGAVLALHNR